MINRLIGVPWQYALGRAHMIKQVRQRYERYGDQGNSNDLIVLDEGPVCWVAASGSKFLSTGTVGKWIGSFRKLSLHIYLWVACP